MRSLFEKLGKFTRWFLLSCALFWLLASILIFLNPSEYPDHENALLGTLLFTGFFAIPAAILFWQNHNRGKGAKSSSGSAPPTTRCESCGSRKWEAIANGRQVCSHCGSQY